MRNQLSSDYSGDTHSDWMSQSLFDDKSHYIYSGCAYTGRCRECCIEDMTKIACQYTWTDADGQVRCSCKSPPILT